MTSYVPYTGMLFDDFALFIDAEEAPIAPEPSPSEESSSKKDQLETK